MSDHPVSVDMSAFARRNYEAKYAWKDDDGNAIEDWPDTAFRVVTNVMAALGYKPDDFECQKIIQFVTERKFMPAGRYLYASGRELHQVNNCLLLKAEDSREGWAEISYKAVMALSTGAGIGVDYSALREEGALIAKTGGKASGPIPLAKMINENGRSVMQGGDRRSAIWGGLRWSHPDASKFADSKMWSPEIRALKEKDFNHPAPLDMTNISILLDDEFFIAYHDKAHYWHDKAQSIYWQVVRNMLKTAEPGFSVDVGENAGETARNACTELTSHDDSDVCNLGSINIGNIETLEEFKEVVKYGTLFLLAGTVYSDLPYNKVHEIRAKNRRLGLGLMGIHEWLLKRGYPYGPCDELATWMDEYAQSTEIAAAWADENDLSHPVKTRAIAPTGTISIVAETSSGIEPIFCVAYKRRVRSAQPDGQDKITFEYVIDPTAKRLIERGVNPDNIEDAYMLSYNVEKRVAFQAWMQDWVDHAISSTINLPYPITDEAEVKAFGDMLIRYLPRLRGITVYPDGSRGGQPLTAVPYHVAKEQEGILFEENEGACRGSVCGS